MWWFLLVLVAVTVLFIWADRRTRGRSGGPEARGERHRRTGGMDGQNG